jgi:hypothetical protein
MKYQIEINYQTGNTFGSHDEDRIIDDVVFEDLESAKEALQIIKKHHEMTQASSGYLSQEERAIRLQEISMQPWAVKSKFGGDYDYSFKVRTSKDSQHWVEVYAFWKGYFERLHEAKIIDADSDELSVSFR